MVRGVKKKSYYLEDGRYLDTTTGRIYEKKPFCEVCGRNWVQTDFHHFLPQGKCLRDLESKDPKPCHWTQEFINENQKLYTVCRECHTKIHNCSSPKTVVNGRRIYDYLWREEKTEVVTKPKTFVVKKNEH